MSLILRNTKGTSLTYTEMDDNLLYLEGLSGATAGDLDGVLSLGNNSGTYSIEMGAGTYIYSSDTVQSLLMDYDDNGTPSIKLVNSSGYDITLGETIRLTGDGCELIVSDTVDITSGLYMGNGTVDGYINSRGVLPLNLGTQVTATGTVSVGNATYPVSISSYINNTLGTGSLEIKTGGIYGDGWELNSDDGTYTGGQLIVREKYTAISNYEGTTGFVAMYGTNGKAIELQNTGDLMNMYTPGDIQINSDSTISLFGSTVDLSPTTGTSNLSLNGNTASITGVLNSSSNSGSALNLNYGGLSNTVGLQTESGTITDNIILDPDFNTDFGTGISSYDSSNDNVGYAYVSPTNNSITVVDYNFSQYTGGLDILRDTALGNDKISVTLNTQDTNTLSINTANSLVMSTDRNTQQGTINMSAGHNMELDALNMLDITSPTVNLSSTTGTSDLSLNGNTASITGVLKSSNGTGLLELDWNGNADTIKMGVENVNQSDWIHIDPLGNTPDFGSGMFSNDFRDDTGSLEVGPSTVTITSEDTTGGIYAKMKTSKLALQDRGTVFLSAKNSLSAQTSIEIDTNLGAAGSEITLKSDKILFNGVTKFSEYTVATLPTVIAGGWIMVTDETGGYTPAFSDGTNWRRTSDRAIVA